MLIILQKKGQKAWERVFKNQQIHEDKNKINRQKIDLGFK